MSDSEDDEDYAEYGTPLEPLDEDALPRKKPFSLEDQVARDKQGRRRFHGAFTGGFSAGFFNSVGSLEGWTPSTFKSSRSGKAEAKSQKPEDFMDDEDMEEHGIAPKVLRATSDFNDSKGKKRIRPHQSDGPIPGKPVLQELLQPARDTVGIKLLKRMGWRPGQGVGPRLTHAEKCRSKKEQQETAGRVYGCLLPNFIQQSQLDIEDESSSEDEGDITFAPDDLEPYLCKTKDNCFGIGYVGLDKTPVLSSHINLFEPSLLNMTEKKKKVSISGQAFGVGVFEEEDADIYGREDMSQYDFSLENTSKTNKTRKPRWSDGNDVHKLSTCLKGFVLSTLPTVRKKFFPPPTLPRDFQPVHIVKPSRFEPASREQSAAVENSTKKRGLERHSLTAEDRSHIIGEAAPVLEKKHAVDTQHVQLEVTTSTGSGDNGRFRPFIAYPEKQLRYEKFLVLDKPSQKDGLTKLQPLSMTEWDREHERMEFEQAARLYRPMSAIMSDRFVSATQPDDSTNPLAAVARTQPDVDKDLVEAAKMKMFGKLTRTTIEWRPTSLLCKRFNIPEPYTGSTGPPNTEPQKKKFQFTVFDYLDAAQLNSQPAPSLLVEKLSQPEEPPPKVSSSPEQSTAKVSADPDNQLPKTVTESIPMVTGENSAIMEFPDLPEKVDLFKAIFLSSSDESDSDDDSEEHSKVVPNLSVPSIVAVDEKSDVLAVRATPAEAFNNTQRNTSPPRGIFANLDLDAINSRKRESTEGIDGVREEPLDPLANVEPAAGTNTVEVVFGPRLPSVLHIPSSKTQLPILPDAAFGVVPYDDRWVEKPCKHPRKEKRSKKSHKKDKKSSKHKKHKNKHKKKHKRSK